ncbi:MAG: hypothetical protein HUU29_13645 [Planctomycetaceae bacterium]|nr:hypothetical protein [Planctomycetaceae bacterium]
MVMPPLRSFGRFIMVVASRLCRDVFDQTQSRNWAFNRHARAGGHPVFSLALDSRFRGNDVTPGRVTLQEKTVRHFVFRLAMPLLALSIAGCATHADRLTGFRAAWGNADFKAADAEINHLLADEADLSVEDVARERALNVPAGEDDAVLLLMEKAMVLLAEGDTGAATSLLRRARDTLDDNEFAGVDDFMQAAISDDTAYDYPGQDYERITIRVLLALMDLISGEGDAYAYALQVGEEQEQILASDFGDKQGYKPREHYRRVAVGAYLQGIMLESTLAPDEARFAYERMLSYQPDSLLGKAGLERVTNGRYANPGNGVLHVFYLAGRGPHFEQTYDHATSDAVRIAGLIATIATDSIVPFAQADIPVPALSIADDRPMPLTVRAGEGIADTETLLDVNQVALEQLSAMMPMILARALVRRAVKSSIITGASKAGAHLEGRDGKGLSEALGALGNLLWTATEQADTRNWCSLPAEIQAARLELPAGEQRVDLGAGMEASVRIRPGRDSYVLVLRPDLHKPGVVFVDRASRALNQPNNAER